MIHAKLTTKNSGPIRELHGVNCAPYEHRAAYLQETTLVDELFGYAGIPRSRLHDVNYPWGGMYFVDIPNIFRDFDADPYDPNNYDFHYTDEYIGCIIRTGAQIVYRLGVTIEHGSKKYATLPPKDNHKWAVICEHIIRHYNEGWNNGFHYNIEYWEIWNEPENPPMWQGTEEEFLELYKVASLHLKNQFPHLKIGGYGGCGFYAAFRPNQGEWQYYFLSFFEDFLKMVKENGCPLDFYTWHIYTRKIEEIRASQQYVRKVLDAHGFTETESHLNEWNFGPEGQNFSHLESLTAASFAAASMIAMQEEGIDMAQYYDASYTSRYNGLINLRTKEFSPVIHPFAAFSRLFKAGTQLKVETTCHTPQESEKTSFEPNSEKLLVTEESPYILAAGKDGNACCMISNYRKADCTLQLDLTDYMGKTLYLYELTDETGFIEIRSEAVTEKTPLTITLSDDKVYYFALCDGEETAKQYLFLPEQAKINCKTPL